VRKISGESVGEPVRRNGKASLSDGFCWISCRKAAGAELPLTGCNEVIYLPDLVLGVFGTHSRSAGLRKPTDSRPRQAKHDSQKALSRAFPL
jgi:hypothetical protein